MVIKDFIIEWWIQAVFGIILTGLTVAVKNIVISTFLAYIHTKE